MWEVTFPFKAEVNSTGTMGTSFHESDDGPWRYGMYSCVHCTHYEINIVSLFWRYRYYRSLGPNRVSIIIFQVKSQPRFLWIQVCQSLSASSIHYVHTETRKFSDVSGKPKSYHSSTTHTHSRSEDFFFFPLNIFISHVSNGYITMHQQKLIFLFVWGGGA